MRTSKQGIDLLKKLEGFSLTAYKDVAGIPTIGTGTIKYQDGTPVKMGDRVTQQQADDLLKDYLIDLEVKLTKLINVPVTQNQFDAIVLLAYNIGTGAFAKSSVLRRLNQRLYTSAAEAFLMWNKARVKGKLQEVKGLTIRRQKERELFLKP